MEREHRGVPHEGPPVDFGGHRGPSTDDVERGYLAAIADGDADALARLYEAYRRTLIGFLTRTLPTPEVAEEVCQDCFAKIWRSARTYRSETATVRTWVFAIARNAAIDWWRTRGRRGWDEPIDALDGTASDESIDERVAANLQGQALRRSVAELPNGQRRCVELAFWGGLSQREIAAQLSVPLGTVKSRTRAGLRGLRGKTVDIGIDGLDERPSRRDGAAVRTGRRPRSKGGPAKAIH